MTTILFATLVADLVVGGFSRRTLSAGTPRPNNNLVRHHVVEHGEHTQPTASLGFSRADRFLPILVHRQ
jgi:hypothetical protein